MRWRAGPYGAMSLSDLGRRIRPIPRRRSQSILPMGHDLGQRHIGNTQVPGRVDQGFLPDELGERFLSGQSTRRLISSTTAGGRARSFSGIRLQNSAMVFSSSILSRYWRFIIWMLVPQL
jgi:hypothetical protein